MSLDLKFFTWNPHMSFTALIFNSSLTGGPIVAVLALSKLFKKSFHVRRLKREVYKLKEKILALEKGHAGGSQGE